MDLDLLSFVILARTLGTRSVMADPFLVNAGGGEDVGPSAPTSYCWSLLQLPTELLVQIVVDLNKEYLNEDPHTTDPLLALRL